MAWRTKILKLVIKSWWLAGHRPTSKPLNMSFQLCSWAEEGEQEHYLSAPGADALLWGGKELWGGMVGTRSLVKSRSWGQAPGQAGRAHGILRGD